ncbi:hypothetical protein PUN28_007908 [Cardiocondyla obscurior]|uniref:Uncharacterized protein n=1 Tax=Cardiocondyla obscurior TaxID=286306 RepID=A0AAW2FX43_9HYME
MCVRSGWHDYDYQSRSAPPLAMAAPPPPPPSPPSPTPLPWGRAALASAPHRDAPTRRSRESDRRNWLRNDHLLFIKSLSCCLDLKHDEIRYEDEIQKHFSTINARASKNARENLAIITDEAKMQAPDRFFFAIV